MGILFPSNDVVILCHYILQASSSNRIKTGLQLSVKTTHVRAGNLEPFKVTKGLTILLSGRLAPNLKRYMYAPT